jgi:hypothetical protein
MTWALKLKSIRHKKCSWQPCFLPDQNKMNNFFYRGPHKYHSIRIRSWKQSVYIWHINQNIWEVDTSFKRAICLFLEDLTLYPSSTVCYPRQHFIFEFYPLKLFYFAGMIFVGSSIKEIIHFILIWQKTWLPWAFLVSDWLKL